MSIPEKLHHQSLAVKNGLANVAPENIDSYVTQVAASGTVTLTGTVTADDTLTLTLASQQLPAGTYDVTVTAADLETLAELATALKDAINNDTLLSGLGLVATSVGAVLTVKWIKGPLGNFATIVFSTSEDATEIGTVVQPNGGSGYVKPKQDARVVYNKSVIVLRYEEPEIVDYNRLSAILAAGVSVE